METDALKYLDLLPAAIWKTLGGIFYYAVIPCALVVITVAKNSGKKASKELGSIVSRV